MKGLKRSHCCRVERRPVSFCWSVDTVEQVVANRQQVTNRQGVVSAAVSHGFCKQLQLKSKI